MDGIIFLLLVAGFIAFFTWRRTVKQKTQATLYAEQWAIIRSLETKLDLLLENKDADSDA